MAISRRDIDLMDPLNQGLYLQLPITINHPDLMVDGTLVDKEVTVVGVNTNRLSPANRGIYVRDRAGNVSQIGMTGREILCFFHDHEESRIKTEDPVPFTKYIFMGSGEYSRAAVDQAREHLDWVFEMLGGEQQPRTCWEPEASPEEVLYEEGLRKKRLAVVRGLVLAMGAEELLKEPTDG